MPSLSQVTRTPGGISNATPNQTMANSGAPDPTWVHAYANDFDTFAPADWTITQTGTTPPAPALIPGDGGVLQITTTAGSSDGCGMQLAVAGFSFVPGKGTFFKFQGNLPDVVTEIFYAGMIAKVASNIVVADGVFLLKPSGQSSLFLYVNNASLGVSQAIALPTGVALTAGQTFELGLHMDSMGNVEVFFNPTTGSNPILAGNNRGRVYYYVSPAAQGLTGLLMTPSFGIQNVSATAHSMNVDFIVASRNR